MHRKQFEQEISELQHNIEEQELADEQEHHSKLIDILEAHESRIEHFEKAHMLRAQKREARIKEEIGLREALSELQATNQEYIPKFISHLIEWEAYFNSLREKQASESGPAQPPAPIE